MALIPRYGSTAAVAAASATLAIIAAGMFGGRTATSSDDRNLRALLLGVQASGIAICPANPVSGDYFTYQGTNYTVYRTTDDAGVPENGVDCTGSACDTDEGCAAAIAAAINADTDGKGFAGYDGGVLALLSRDAGLAANLPLAWHLQTRVTETNTNTRTNTVTNTATATVTNTNTVTNTITLTDTVTNTVTVTLTDTDSQTYTDTATETDTELSTDTDTGTDTATGTATGTDTATETASGTATGTATGTNTNTNTVTSAGTSTGMSGGADPVVSGGPNLGIIANDFDPSVTGLIAPLGSTARTADGSKLWTKTGTANTAWTQSLPLQ